MNGTFTSEPVPFLRNLSEPGARFRAAAPNHPEALLEEPQAFQAVGEKVDRFGKPRKQSYRNQKKAPTPKLKTPYQLSSLDISGRPTRFGEVERRFTTLTMKSSTGRTLLSPFFALAAERSRLPRPGPKGWKPMS